MDFLNAVEEKTKAQLRLDGLQEAVANAEAEVQKCQELVGKAKENLDKTLSDGARGQHKLDALRKAQAKLTEAIGWHQNLEAQVRDARNGVELAKEILPQLLAKAVREKVKGLNEKMEAVFDAVTEVVAEADRIYLSLVDKYKVNLPPQDRELLIPMPTRAKDSWLFWIGPVTRGLQNLSAKRRAGEN